MFYFLFYFRQVERNETHRLEDVGKVPRKKRGVFNRVFDDAGRRVRGLWIRNGTYYAQVRFSKLQTARLPLHDAKTLPQAVSARQALKMEIKAGTVTGPGTPTSAAAKTEEPATTEKERTLAAAVLGYQRDRDTLREKDPQTCAREDSGLRKWCEIGGATHITKIDAKFAKDFATWRLARAERALQAKAAGLLEGKLARTLSGRTLDLNKLALNHVLEWAVTERWLAEVPALKWKKKAKAPKPVRLISESELVALCKANLEAATPEALQSAPKSVRHLLLGLARTAQAFADYLRLIFLTGGRESEVIEQKWSNVDWGRRVLQFPGEAAKAGGGEPASPREIPFYDKLEAHLRLMWERCDKESKWMFPGRDDNQKHVGSFRKQLLHAKMLTGMGDVGFHHGKHFFISACVMRGIDFKTIATWASHRDGGVLVAAKYGHLAPGHAQAQAAKLNGGASLIPVLPSI